MTIFIGIDVSKQKLDFALTIDGTSFKTKTFKNNINEFDKISLWLQSFDYCCLHFCIESTSIYHNDIADYLRTREDSIVCVINPYQSKHFAQSLNVRSKTDKADSCLLAKYAYLNKPAETFKPSDEQQKLRELTRFLESLVDDRTRQKIKIETLRDNDLKDIVYKKIDHINQQIVQVEILIKNFIKQHSTIKETIKLLQTIEGVGERTAWTLTSEMLWDENISVKAQTAYAGLDPIEKTSGSSIKGKPRISHKGNARLRKCLYMPALTRIYRGGYFGEFYNRLVAKGKGIHK